MDGRTTVEEEVGLQALEKVGGKGEGSYQIPEATGAAVTEEENLGGDELNGEEGEDPVEINGSMEDGESSGQAVGDGEVGDGEALEEGESNVEEAEGDESNGQRAEDDESDGRVATLRRGGISAETIEEPAAESGQEKVCFDQLCSILNDYPCQRLMMV